MNEERDEGVAEGKPVKKQSRLGALFQSHRKLFILLIIAIIIMLLSLAYYLGTQATRSMSGDGSGSVTGSNDHNAVTIDQDYLNSLNIGGSTDQDQGQDYFIHHCFLNLYFQAGQLEQEMPVWNDPGNTESMVVKLYIVTGDESDDQATGQGAEPTADQAASDGELLFTSGTIPPGMMLSSIKLTSTLRAGDYKATVVSTPMDANGTPGNSVRSMVDLHVR